MARRRCGGGWTNTGLFVLIRSMPPMMLLEVFMRWLLLLPLLLSCVEDFVVRLVQVVDGF